MTPLRAPAPAPGITVPGVGVPAPTEQQATDAAIEHSGLIAIVLIGLIIKAAVTYVTRRIDFRLVLVLVLLGVGAYQFGKVN